MEAVTETTKYRGAIQLGSSFNSRFDTYKRIEAILERAGPAGVHKAYFLYDLRWPQHQARICEMNKLGWNIESVHLPKSQWVSGIQTKYVLRSKPLEVAPGQDWYERQTGQKRLGSLPEFELTP
jgi:hypothetical protein